jgi:hypothetical protein
MVFALSCYTNALGFSKMTNKFALLTGFFTPMFVTVTVDHLYKQPGMGEVMDSVITSLFFTGVFAVGITLGKGFPLRATPGSSLFVGFLAGLFVQILLWGFWLMVPHEVRYSFGVWPLVGHLILFAGVGYSLSRICGRRKQEQQIAGSVQSS